VTCCIRGSSANGSSVGQVATARSQTSSTTAVVGAERGAVERREQELAAAQVGVAVEEQERLRAEDRPEEPVHVAHVHHVGRAEEHLADDLGVAGDDDVARAEPQREERPVAAPGALEQGDGSGDPLQGLGGRGQARAGRQGVRDGHGTIIGPGWGPADRTSVRSAGDAQVPGG
jgi:hypothetical protein